MTIDEVAYSVIGATSLWAFWPTIKKGLGMLRWKRSTSPEECVKHLRFSLAVKSPDVREKGQVALDIVEGIIND